MYERESGGYTVKWQPEKDEIAIRAMELTDGTGVPTHVNLPDNANVPVENDVAQRIQECYKWLEYIEEHSDDDLEAYGSREEVEVRYEELRNENENGSV